MPAFAAIPAIVQAGIVSAGASVAGGLLSSHKQTQAAKAQQDASHEANVIQQKANDQAFQLAQEQQNYDRWLTSATSAARQPYLDAAAAAAGGIGSSYQPAPYKAADPFVAPSMADALNDPGYKASQAELQRSIEHGAAANGTLLTGGTGEAIAGRTADLAANRYADVYSRAQSLYAMNEGLRKSAYDTNNTNAYNAAQLQQSASLARINELLSLAGLAQPGAYPGASASGKVSPAAATGGGGMEEPRTYLDIADQPNEAFALDARFPNTDSGWASLNQLNNPTAPQALQRTTTYA